MCSSWGKVVIHYFVMQRLDISKRSAMSCLFDLIFTSHQQFFSYNRTSHSGLNQYKARINVLAQGHNGVTSARLEPAPPRSRVKHSTTEPSTLPLSHCAPCVIQWAKAVPLRLGGNISVKIFFMTVHGKISVQYNLCKTTTLKKSENWFSRPIIA